MTDFGIFDENIFLIIRAVAGVFAFVHLLIGLVLFQQIFTFNRKIHSPHGNTVTFIGLLHILGLAAILILILII